MLFVDYYTWYGVTFCVRGASRRLAFGCVGVLAQDNDIYPGHDLGVDQ